MPLYLIERDYAEKMKFSFEGAYAVDKANEETGVDWLFSFLSADKTKSYCLYQAEDPGALMRAAELAGIPANKIVEVDKFDPTSLPARTISFGNRMVRRLNRL